MLRPKTPARGFSFGGCFPVEHNARRSRGCRGSGGHWDRSVPPACGAELPAGLLAQPLCTKPELAGAQTPPVAGGRSSQCLPTAALPRNEEDRRSGELRDGGEGGRGMLWEGLRRCRLQGEQHRAQPVPCSFSSGKQVLWHHTTAPCSC